MITTEMISEKIYKSIVEGLQIISQYPGAQVNTEHDMIYAGPEDDSLVSTEDTKRLEKLGWSKSSEGGWKRHT